MSDLLQHQLEFFTRPEYRPLLAQGRRGIEREALRVDPQGRLALTPHPAALGSALTHPHVTTDYSEALLELITSPHADPAQVLVELDRIHRFVQQRLGSELMWAHSMPALLPAEPEIPIAWYGSSHIGMLKHVYRRGLAVRYGKAMQCIAGIHYNFSLSEDLWDALRKDQGSPLSQRDFQSERYIAMIRNFQQRAWLLMYLFGASPALPLNFLQGRPHQLEKLADDTLYLPYATSLRMSDLGYQNKAQVGLIPPYNTLGEYMRSMARAVQLPYPEFEAIGLRKEGQWIQISTNVLQIENEYYATIRPKRVTRTGERPLQALCERGVQYIEVRCMDVDPFEPVGISLQTARFLDVFLTACALTGSPLVDLPRANEYRSNFATVVREGRRPGLLLHRDGAAVPLAQWGQEMLDEILPVARLLDQQSGGNAHVEAVRAQAQCLASPELTPSARVLDQVRAHQGSFHRFALEKSREHAASLLQRPVTGDQLDRLCSEVEQSLSEQGDMERRDTGSFDEFIEAYRAATPTELRC
ncbi:glutamate--cysteine ligase [Lacisediminimonas profundi]|uniref:glutamate--cysteine ligase n=1 Tax=Lacisediminimonas profundi TaxID=2603856 RepID=UPI00124B91A1|nr:glutamate--cysteine ligase [Lacisediminimonas profundi]